MFRRSRRSAEDEQERFHAFGNNSTPVELDEPEVEMAALEDDPIEEEQLPEAVELPVQQEERVQTPVIATTRRVELPLDEEEDASTVVGPATAVEGVLRTSDDVKVEGSINGTVEVGGALMVERGGSVDAKVEAGSVRVRGRLHGEVKSNGRLAVMRGGHIDGNFKMAALVIEEGATVQGRFSMRGMTEQVKVDRAAENNR